MRFGLSDLDELPSLKEFEQLARAALGADEGIAPIEPESEVAPETLDTAPEAAIPANGTDATPQPSRHDSSNSADTETKEKAEKPKAESASANTGAGST
jgi:hypothetical protein